MKNLLILCSALFSASAFSAVPVTVEAMIAEAGVDSVAVLAFMMLPAVAIFGGFLVLKMLRNP